MGKDVLIKAPVINVIMKVQKPEPHISITIGAKSIIRDENGNEIPFNEENLRVILGRLLENK